MELVGRTFYFDWEVEFMEWLQSVLGTTGALIMSVFSLLGETLVAVAVFGFLYWCYDKKIGKQVGLSFLIAMTVNPMIKNIVLRRRPYFDNPSIKCLKPVEAGADIYDIAEQGYSFPSMHATDTVTLFSSIPMYIKKNWLKIVGVAAPLLCGLSRVALGVHYPTDVLFGWLIGLIVIILVPYLYRRIRNRWVFYGIVFAVTVPGFFYCRSTDFFSTFGLLAGFVLGVEFEEKLVGFENTTHPLRCILRMLGGIAIFYAMNTLLKLPFSEDFLSSATVLSYCVRTLRYALSIFVVIGIYPIVFKCFDRLYAKK